MKTDTAPSPAPEGTPTVSLHMADGTVHYIACHKILRLASDAQRAIEGQPQPVPDSAFDHRPELRWFRDCVKASSNDGSGLYSLITSLLKGPDMRPMSFYTQNARLEMANLSGVIDERSDG